MSTYNLRAEPVTGVEDTLMRYFREFGLNKIRLRQEEYMAGETLYGDIYKWQDYFRINCLLSTRCLSCSEMALNKFFLGESIEYEDSCNDDLSNSYYSSENQEYEKYS